MYNTSQLYEVNKPYQYIGEEFLSYKKDFSSSKINLALCFPDKYEIGISNFGVRILYDLINKHPDFLADRAYAPEIDYKNVLEHQNKKLYAVESKKPLCDFDIVGFSLQYELSYPSVLKMLELSNISIKSCERSENEPIVIAGGPCTYNPLPIIDFIDVFQIGDGEKTIIDICETVKNAKKSGFMRIKILEELSKIEGVYVPKFPKKVRKSVCELNYENHPKFYPIPYCQSVHDRAVVELRRGCGRMCRFCQAGYTNLPIREREASDVVKIARELVQNTGYDEYSLLSLSSNDYKNIKEVVKDLSFEMNQNKVSASLPSQRIDKFDIELQNLIQDVRKSSITLAPEAGSQRLRNVINKNLNENQILETAMTCYQNGYSHIKFYFMIGLPSETYNDLDEMYELLRKIAYQVFLYRKENGLKNALNITVTLSIFVPKPFTPFQFFGQTDIEELKSRIYYLKDKIKTIKGVKLNYHDFKTSLVEAVLTRGDKNLNNFIYELYKNGVYLSSWDENFDFNLWDEIASKLGINFNYEAQKTFELSENLPWDFIDVGVSKKWLENEYKNALEEISISPCEIDCCACGACDKNNKKVLAKNYISITTEKNLGQNEEIFKYRIKFQKINEHKFLSHLDLINTFKKAFARAKIKLNYTQGFNPSPKIAIGNALPIFVESICEFADIELKFNYENEQLFKLLNEQLPNNLKIISINSISKNEPAIDKITQWAKYEISFLNSHVHKENDLLYIKNKISSDDEIFMKKKNKKGVEKLIDIKQSLKSIEIEEGLLKVVLKVGQNSDIAQLRPDLFVNLFYPNEKFRIKRIEFLDRDLKEL